MTFPHTSTITPCGAKTRSGGKCKTAAMPNGRCRMHGGKSLRGMAHPNAKHLRYAKDMPARLSGRYQEALDDPELLSTRHEIALVEARLNDLLTRADTGEAKILWEKARKLNQDIQKAIHNENYGATLVHAAELDFIIGSGLTDYEAWYQIQALIEQRRKLSESEQKRLVAAQQMITSEQAMTFVAAIVDSVRRNVTDRNVLNAIQIDIAALMNVQSKAEIGVNKA
jgi:hypothetical protein